MPGAIRARTVLIMNKASGAPKIGDAIIVVDVQRDFLPGGARISSTKEWDP